MCINPSPSTTTCAANHGNDDKMAQELEQQQQIIHEDPIWKQLLHVDEVVAAISFLTKKPLRSNLELTMAGAGDKADDLVFCDYIMGSVARPYAAAIRQLPPETLVNVMILHHSLRALDTIEDDMTAFSSNDEVKIQHLRNFCATALTDPTWNLSGVGEGDEALLLEEFPKVHSIFSSLDPAAQHIIRDITGRMAEGMIEFIVKRNFAGPLDLAEYDRYCHFVAGLVAEGLVRLFCLAGLEQASLEVALPLADHVGFFLQKVNITRDFLEDYQEGRIFWPHSIWSKYTSSLDQFATQQHDPKVLGQAVHCLNEIVTNALEEVPHLLTFLSQLQCQETYRFFALLLLGAFATLRECYNNDKLFTGKIRIRKGFACQLAWAAVQEPDALQEFFGVFATQIRQSAPTQDPSYKRTVQICSKIIKVTQPARDRREATRQLWWFCAFIPAVVGLILYLLFDGGFSNDTFVLPSLVVAVLLGYPTFSSSSPNAKTSGCQQPLELASSLQSNASKPGKEVESKKPVDGRSSPKSVVE